MQASPNRHSSRYIIMDYDEEVKSPPSPSGMTDQQRLLQVFGSPTQPTIDEGIEVTAANVITPPKSPGGGSFMDGRTFAANAKSVVLLQRWKKRAQKRIVEVKNARPAAKAAVPHNIIVDTPDDAPPVAVGDVATELGGGANANDEEEQTDQAARHLAKNIEDSAGQVLNSQVYTQTLDPPHARKGNCSLNYGNSQVKQGLLSAFSQPNSSNFANMAPEHADPAFTISSVNSNEEEETASSSQHIDITQGGDPAAADSTLNPEESNSSVSTKIEVSAKTNKIQTIPSSSSEHEEEKKEETDTLPVAFEPVVVAPKSSVQEMSSEEAEEPNASPKVAMQATEPKSENEASPKSSVKKTVNVSAVPTKNEDIPPESAASSTSSDSEAAEPRKPGSPTFAEGPTADSAKSVAAKLAAQRSKSKSPKVSPKSVAESDDDSDDEEDRVSVQEEAILAQQRTQAAKKKYGATPARKLSSIINKFETTPDAAAATPDAGSSRASPPNVEVSPMTPSYTPGAYTPSYTPTPTTNFPYSSTPPSYSTPRPPRGQQQLTEERMKMEMMVMDLQQEKLRGLEEKIGLETKVMELTLEVKRLQVQLQEADMTLMASEKKRMESDEAYVQLGNKMKEMDADAKSVAQQTHASMVTNGQQQALMQESGKMLEYLRKEVVRLRKENKELKGEVENLQDNAQRLQDANAQAENNFGTLTTHAKSELKKAEFAAEEFKLQIKELKMAQAEQKDEIRMKQAAYVSEVQSRLQYQDAMTRIVELLQEKCRNSRLVEEVLQITDDVEDFEERVHSPSAKKNYDNGDEEAEDLNNSSMVGRFTSMFS